MNIFFVLRAATELADDIFVVPQEYMNQCGGIHHEYCAIRDNVGDWQEQWRILFIFCLVESIAVNDSAEVVPATSVVEWRAHRNGHVL